MRKSVTVCFPTIEKCDRKISGETEKGEEINGNRECPNKVDNDFN